MYQHEKNESRCPLGGRIIIFILSMFLLTTTLDRVSAISEEKPVKNTYPMQVAIIPVTDTEIESASVLTPILKSNEEIISEINSGIWGNGEERKTRLTDAGYNYDEIQSIINARYPSAPKVTPTYTYTGTGLTKSGGVYMNPKTGLKETWYSQKVLPGGGLKISGRHVNNEGFVCDGDGYICVSSSTYPKGTIVETSRGMGKVYDSGCAPGVLDIYVNW